jgi:hypothetical protein
MTHGETLIGILLGVIAYFLYQIARQLSFLTGRKMRSPFSNFLNKANKPKSKPLPKEEKLTN